MQPQDPYNPNQPVQPQVPPVAPPPAPDFNAAPPVAPPPPQPMAAPATFEQPAPQPMQPAQPFMQAPPQQQMPVMGGVGPQMPMAPAKNKNMMLWLIIAGVVVVLGGVAVYLYLTFFQSLSLTEFSNSHYSLKVPTDYTQKAEGDAEIFTEKGDEASASSVYAYYAPFPRTLSAAELATVKGTLKTQLQSVLGNLNSNGVTLSNSKTTDGTFNGQDSLTLTGDLDQDGKKAGQMKVIAVVTSNEIYIVGVAVHNSDSGLANATDTILNSFKLK